MYQIVFYKITKFNDSHKKYTVFFFASSHTWFHILFIVGHWSFEAHTQKSTEIQKNPNNYQSHVGDTQFVWKLSCSDKWRYVFFVILFIPPLKKFIGRTEQRKEVGTSQCSPCPPLQFVAQRSVQKQYTLLHSFALLETPVIIQVCKKHNSFNVNQ